MKKGLLIAAILFTTGVVCVGIGSACIGFDYRKLNPNSEMIHLKQSYETSNINQISIDISYGKLTVDVSSEIEKVELDITKNKNEDWLYKVNSNNTLEIKTDNDNLSDWWNMFKGFHNNAELNLRIPKALVLNKLSIEVSAGDIRINDIKTNDLFIDVSAGKLELNNVTTNSVISKNSAGETTFNNCQLSSANLDVSAGSINLNNVEVNKLDFDLSAGDINAYINGYKKDYTIDIDVSAGNCNIDNQIVNGDKYIKGDVSAGNATFRFLNEETK